MSNEKKTSNNGSITFCGLLFITFLVLKLINVINWSWWWITAPLWGGIAIGLIIIVIGIIITLINNGRRR